MAVLIDPSTRLQNLYREAEESYMQPLWTAHNLATSPRKDVEPWLWRWQTLRNLLHEAGDMVGLGGADAERRVFTLRNPSLPLGSGTTRTIGAAVQLVRPGEQAPTHRHSMAAMRFIIEGQGGCTIVDSEPLTMEPGDFLLTPAWSWHGHTNEVSTNMLWLDILDSPLVRSMDWAFYEEYSQPKSLQASGKPVDDSAAHYAYPALLPPSSHQPSANRSPLLSYKWASTRTALYQLAQADWDAFDGVVLSYVNPLTGGPVLPTVGTSTQLLLAGQRTLAHRHTSNVIYHVAEGRGSSVIDGLRFEWQRGDIFCVPTWCWHEHAAAPDCEAILFAASDAPVVSALGLLRDEPYHMSDGHQAVQGVFAG